MGIRNLNKFLRTNCSESIYFKSLCELNGKKIAVDISIYMYKYKADNCLIENIYLMLSIFKHYNIIPVFIFDGKPPKEKHELLNKRKNEKQIAKTEYNILKKKLQNETELDEFDKHELILNMDLLKKQFITINKDDINTVKSLIRAYGASYYDAHGEADELCAMLVIRDKVWACLSEDMDMFVYGCPRVIRYLSLLNHTAVLYNLPEILSQLGLTHNELMEICILSGTDYNSCIDVNKPDLYTTLKLFKKYHKQSVYDDFYMWLYDNTNYIQNIEELTRIKSMFELKNRHFDFVNNININNGIIKNNELTNILQRDGFIFPQKCK